MDEYISREEAIKELREVYENEYPTASGDFDEYASHDVPNVLRNIPATDVQPIVYAHKTINVGRRSYCSNCGKLAIMEDFCSKCGAKVKDGDIDNNTRNLTDEETDIYNSWLEAEAETIDEISLL